MAGHPPTPRRFTQPNFLGIEHAVADVTFPIDKRDLMLEVDGKTVLVQGANHDLRELVKDLNDDYFDSIEEFHVALENHFRTAFDQEVSDPDAPVQPASAWNDPNYGKQRGAADFAAYMDVHPDESPR